MDVPCLYFNCARDLDLRELDKSLIPLAAGNNPAEKRDEESFRAQCAVYLQLLLLTRLCVFKCLGASNLAMSVSSISGKGD